MAELDTARRMIIRGKADEAARLLAEFIAEHPDHVDAWLLMAQAVPEPAQKLDCYHRVLEIDPANSAALKGVRAARQQLLNKKAVTEKEKSPSAHPVSTSIPKPSFLHGIFRLKIILPILGILILTVAGVLHFRNKPSTISPTSTPVPSTPLAAKTTIGTAAATVKPSPTEATQKVFAGFSSNLFYVQNGKLWSWQKDATTVMTDAPTTSSIRVILEGQKVLYTDKAILWAINVAGGSRVKLVDFSNPLKATPSPSPSSSTIAISGYLPKSVSILVSFWPEPANNTQTVDSSALYSVKADGSTLTNLLAAGQGGVPYPSPNEQYLTVVNSKSIQLMDLTNGKAQVVLTYPTFLPGQNPALPVIVWSTNSSRFGVAIPPADITSNLNATTALWMVDPSGVSTAQSPIATRGGKVILSPDLQTVLYQLNLTSADDTFGEIHKVALDGSEDTILLEGNLAHLVGWGSKPGQFLFQPQDDPSSLWAAASVTGDSHLVVSGLDGDPILRFQGVSDQISIVETGQATGYHLWLVRYDGTPHPPLSLAENQDDHEIPFDFVP